MSDCVWMFGDAGTGALGFSEIAYLNPWRWSGSLPFETAIDNLKEVLSNGSRPILVKVPSGVSTSHRRFETTEEAIRFLIQSDPAELVRRRHKKERAVSVAKAAAGDKETAESAVTSAREEVASQEEAVSKANEEAKVLDDAAKQATARVAEAQSDGKGEWMYGDAGDRLLGYKVARLNPFRWSGSVPFLECVRQLRELKNGTNTSDNASREIVVRVPPGPNGEVKRFSSCDEAICYLDNHCPVKQAARKECEEAEAAHLAAEAKVRDAEAILLKTKKKLAAAEESFTESEEALELANKHAEEAQKALEEMSSPS